MKFDLAELKAYMMNNFQILPDQIYLWSDLKQDLGVEIWDRIELIVFIETTQQGQIS